jgi:hypothetical protein
MKKNPFVLFIVSGFMFNSVVGSAGTLTQASRYIITHNACRVLQPGEDFHAPGGLYYDVRVSEGVKLTMDKVEEIMRSLSSQKQHLDALMKSDELGIIADRL